MKAIVYTSETGHTAEYARLVGVKTGLPVYTLSEAESSLADGTEVIYLGWLFANTVKGYKRAMKKLKLSAVLAVGLCDTGTSLKEVRRVNAIPEKIPLFTVQGGMDKEKLKCSYRFVINMLTRVMEKKKDKTEGDARMVFLLKNDQNYVKEENLSAFLEWYNCER